MKMKRHITIFFKVNLYVCIYIICLCGSVSMYVDVFLWKCICVSVDLCVRENVLLCFYILITI